MGVVSDSHSHYGEDVYATRMDRPARSIGLIFDVPKKASLSPMSHQVELRKGW